MGTNFSVRSAMTVAVVMTAAAAMLGGCAAKQGQARSQDAWAAMDEPTDEDNREASLDAFEVVVMPAVDQPAPQAKPGTPAGGSPRTTKR